MATGALAAAATSTAIVPKELGKAAAAGTAKTAAQNGLKYNPFGPDVFIETGKVVGQNSTRLAGNVIVGVSAAFLVWDAIDLGINIADLVKVYENTHSVRGSITVQLTSCLKGLTNQVNLLLIKHKQSS